MHTDEYEISIAREIGHCEKVVGKIEKDLDRRQRCYGLGYPAAAAGELAIGASELAGWRDDVEALPVWRQRLEEYREALAVMRISASRFE